MISVKQLKPVMPRGKSKMSHDPEVKEYSTVFTPQQQTNLQYKRLDIDEFLSIIDERESGDEAILHRIERGKNVYDININNVRYRVFKDSRVCACCGLRATRAYLDLDVQTTKKVGHKKYHVNLYSETLDPKANKLYLTLFVKDKIDITSDNETAYNYRTLCFNCACMKTNSGLDLTPEQMQQLLFPAYRAYRGVISLNQCKEYLEDYRRQIEGAYRLIENVTGAFDKIPADDPRVPALKIKIENAKKEIEFLGPACDDFELFCQKTGRFDSSEFGKKVSQFYKGLEDA